MSQKGFVPNQLINVDPGVSPPELVMRFLIGAINAMGSNMITQTAKAAASDKDGFHREYQKILTEINDTAEKIDGVLDQTVDNSAKLGVVVLAVLQVAIMAMSTYVDASGGDITSELALGSEMDELLAEEPEAPLPGGVVLRGKSSGNH